MTDHLLQAIAHLTEALTGVDQATDQLANRRNNLIRLALDTGRTPTEIARAAGITRQRVQQIKGNQ